MDHPRLHDLLTVEVTKRRDGKDTFTQCWTLALAGRGSFGTVEPFTMSDEVIYMQEFWSDRGVDYCEPAPFFKVRSTCTGFVWLRHDRYWGWSFFGADDLVLLIEATLPDIIGPGDGTRPPPLAQDELAFIAASLQRRLPLFEDCDYVEPDYAGDGSGRYLVRDVGTMLADVAALSAPAVAPAAWTRYELGTSDGGAWHVDLSPGPNGMTFRLLKPDALPLWLTHGGREETGG